jgi:hypothetical protein
MTSIINLGCDIAEIHHQYSAVHNALFGASSYRLVIAQMTGRTASIYQESLQTLDQLQARLSVLAGQIAFAEAGASIHQANQLRDVLTEYAENLNSAIDSLRNMYSQLERDADGYHETPNGGQSAFNRDKIKYDRLLLHLEQLGRRLNRLFSRF